MAVMALDPRRFTLGWAQAICDALIASLEPVLNAYKPSWMRNIYFRACTLGENPFELFGMNMVKEHDGQPIRDAVEFETNVRQAQRLACSWQLPMQTLTWRGSWRIAAG